MAETTEYAPATQDALPGGESKKKRVITWLAIGGAVGALLLGVAAVSFTAGQANPPQVAAGESAPDAEWQEWHDLASPTIRAAGEKWIAGLDAASAGDMETFAALAEESADLWADVPGSPSTELDTIVLQTSVMTYLAGSSASDGLIGEARRYASESDELVGEFVEIIRAEGLL